MSNPPESAPWSRIRRWLPALIFGIALLIRLAGVTWGLPNANRYWSYHPDEPVNLLAVRQIHVGSGDFDPSFYNYGTLYLTLCSVANDVVSAYSPLPANPTRSQLAEQDAKALLAGRLINCLAGAGTAALVFLGLRRFQPDLFASIGAALVAVSPGHTMHSRFMTVDVFATFLCAATLYGALRLLPKNPDDPPPNYWKWALWAAAFAGLAAGTKYNAVVVLIAPIVAIVWVRPSRWLAMLAGALLVATVAFFVATPGALTNHDKFMADLTYELTHSRTGHGLVFEGAGSSLGLHAVNLIVGVGLLATGLGVAGLIWGSAKKHAPIAVVGSFAALYLLVLSRAEIAFLRYTFPLVPCLGFGVGWFVSLVKGVPKWERAAIAVAILAIGGLPLGDGLYASGRIMAAMAGVDSRDAIARYFQSMPVDKPISIGVIEDPWFYTPPYYPNANAPRFVSVEARDQAMRESLSPRIVRHIGPNGERSDWDIGLLETDQPMYVVYSSFESGDLERLSRTPNLRPEIQSQVDAYVAFKKRLEADYALQVVLSGLGTTVHDMEYVRPTLWVWKRKPIR